MMRTKNCRNRRRAATLVETAFVLVPLIVLFMGIFQYGLLLMDWNLLIGAAQQGCRFALANNLDPTLNTDVQNIVIKNMASRNTSFSNLTVTVTGTHQGVPSAVNNLAAGDPITVTVSGNYLFLNIIPLVPAPNSVTFSTSSTMICEGGP